MSHQRPYLPLLIVKMFIVLSRNIYINTHKHYPGGKTAWFMFRGRQDKQNSVLTIVTVSKIIESIKYTNTAHFY